MNVSKSQSRLSIITSEIGFGFLLLVSLLNPSSMVAQSDSCKCQTNFDELANQTEINYLGYHQKIKSNTKEVIKYESFKKSLKAQSLNAKIENCIQLLQKYTSYFKDGHLSIFERPKYDENELRSFQAGIRKYSIIEQQAVSYFDKNKNSLDPIEGIWFADANAYRLAIIRNPSKADEFLAVVLNSTNPSWKAGFVKCTFVKNATHGYAANYHLGNFAPANYQAEVHKNCLVNIGALTYWGKSYPNTDRDQETINKSNPILPTITRIDSDNMLISIPSFLVEYPYMDSLIRARKEEITTTKNLLIDIRGNGGGNAVYMPLIGLYYTKPSPGGQGLALSSPNTIEYYKLLASYSKKIPGDTTTNLYERVVKDMEKQPGQIVKGPLWPVATRDTIYPFPKNVCILADRICASAAESFILHSKEQSDRVTTFGENTCGMIDYVSTTSIKLLCAKQNYFAYYPTSTLHTRIPSDGYNVTGIPPDIRIKGEVKDKVQFVIDWLKQTNAKNKLE